MHSVDIPPTLLEDLRAHSLEPTDLVLYVNSTCNLRCKHCYVGTELLNESNYYSLCSVQHFVQGLSPLDRVTVLGGEPFLHPQFAQIAAVFADHPCKERRVTTNLMFYPCDALRVLKEGKFRVCVSLDGHTPALHDQMRGNGAFVVTTGNLVKLLANEFDVEVTHTITQDNIAWFWDFISLCKSFGLKQLNLHRVSLRGNALTNRRLSVGATEWRKFTRELELAANTSEAGLRVRYEVGFATQAEYDALVASGMYQHHSMASYYSPSGGNRVVIFPNRHIYVSSEAFGTSSYIGDFRSGQFKFNDSLDNELLSSATPGFNTSHINREVTGDAEYPIPLSVSYRQMVVV